MEELLKVMSQWYVMKMDWGGTSFGGITLKWNYDGERWIELSLPGYIEKSWRDLAIPNQKDHKTPHIQLRQQNSHGRHQRNTANLRVYYVVHAGMKHNNNQGAERNRAREIKSH